MTTTEAPSYPQHLTHVWLTPRCNYIRTAMRGCSYLLTFHGRYSDVSLSCSLCRKKFLLWPSAALALKERLPVCLQSQNPTVKSGVVRGSCTHASKLNKCLPFHCRHPLACTASYWQGRKRACGCIWEATSNFHIHSGCWYHGWSVIFVRRDR